MYAHVHGDNSMCCYLPTVLYLERYQAHRALELLEDYHAKLTRPQDKQLRLAIERVIRIFKSRLFQALLGKSVILSLFYEMFTLEHYRYS
ncbi:Disks large 1 tumor suppressor protein [Anthophora quadrimaculata]